MSFDAGQATGSGMVSASFAAAANSTSSARLVPESALVTPPWTRVHGGVTKALTSTTLADLVAFAGPPPTAEPAVVA